MELYRWHGYRGSGVIEDMELRGSGVIEGIEFGGRHTVMEGMEV